ncbi:MAG: acyl-CoA thioesterase [Bdellovibrionales bacterium]
MKFSKQYRIPFDLCDPSQFIFYGNAFKISHQTIEDFVEHIGIGWDHWFKHRNFIVPIRHAKAEYFSPLKAGDKINIELSIAKLSPSSVTFLCRLISNKTTCVEISSVHVFVDKVKSEKSKMPDEFKEKLERYT